MTITADTANRAQTTGTAAPHGQPAVFTASRAVLADALATVGLAVSARPVSPALGGVLLEGHDDGHLTVSGFDYETAVTVTVPDAVTAPGLLLIDHAETVRVLAALVKGQTKRAADAAMVTITAPTPDTPTVTANGYTVPVTAYPRADYPTLPAAPPASVEVRRERFVSELARVLCAVSRDDTLPTFTGVNVEFTPAGLSLAATDRYRLAAAHLPTLRAYGTSPRSALVSGELLAKLPRGLTADTVAVGRDGDSNGWVSLVCGDVSVTVRPMDWEFVKYRAIIPATCAASFTADRADLLALANRAAAILAAKGDRGRPVALTVTPEAVTIAPVLTERAEDIAAPELTAKTDGYPDADPVRFTFTAVFLIDALKSITGPTVTMHTQTSPDKPVVLAETGDAPGDETAYRHLLMPTRPQK